LTTQPHQSQAVPDVDEAAVILEDINVHALSSSESSVVCVAKKNQIVKVVNYDSEWVQISFMHKDAVVTGWIKSRYLSKF
jgi:uncharacterized protein YgiM (DUF1202 family)